jgi:hypothetical protein
MKISITLSILTSIFLFSCQKEGDFSRVNGSGSGGSVTGTGTRLIKMVAKNGTDSSVNIYTYNSSGKLIGIATTGNDGGTPVDTRETFVRNTQGILQKEIIKDADLIQNGVDSFVINVRYDATSARYTGWTLIIDVGGTVLRDSAVLLYNATGKVITESGYSDNGSGTYKPTSKFDFTYSGNNLASKKGSSYNSGTYLEDFTITDEYDTKTSPLILGNEAFVIDPNSIAPYYSPNNILKETVTYPTDPTEILTISYTYNSSNKPGAASFNIQPDNTTFSVTYYYQ